MESSKLAAALVRWRLGDVQRATLVVKATFALSPTGAAMLVGATPLAASTTSERAPRKSGAEVLFVGSAYAKGGEAVARRKVRLVVLAAERALVDKTLTIVGERRIHAVTKAVSQPQRFERMPITWERAFGGPGFPDNPVGIGFDAKDVRLPSIVSDAGAQVAAGLAPMDLRWPARARALSVVSDGDVALPAAFDFSAFLAAPPDQRVDALPGREEIVLVGLNARHDEVRCLLPDVRPRGALRAGALRVEVPLVRDTLLVDGDALTATVLWRGDVELRAPLHDGPLELEVTLPDDAPAAKPATKKPSTKKAPPGPPIFLQETQRLVTRSTIDGGFEPPARTGEMVPIVNETPLVVFAFPWQLSPPQDVLIVVVKGTFDLRDDRAALAPEQMLPSGDVHHDGDVNASLRYPSDFAAFKPKADVMLVGSAPPGDDGNIGHVSLRVGKLERRLAIFGDRTWHASQATTPARFERMPLRWERALGGQLSRDNPVGIGFRTETAVPNLQDPERLLATPNATARPACFAPVSPTWQARTSKLGTYDTRWMRTRWPYFPVDFDPSYFNAAPPEQQVDYLAGDERFRLGGFDDAPITGKLPAIRPRAFVQRTREAKGDLIEVLLRLDTCWFDVDARKLVLTWRGFVDVADDDAPDVSVLYVAADPVTDPAARLHAALVARSLLRHDAPVGLTAANEPDVSLREAYERVRAAPVDRVVSRAPAEDVEVLLAALRARQPVSGRDFRGVDLAGTDLTGADLSGAILSGARLASARLAGADLSRADLTDADLTGADLSRAVLEHARLVGARCQGATLVGAQLTGAHVEGARFDEANLQDARLYDVEGARVRFDRARLRGLRADDAKLPDSTFAGVDAEGAVFDGADLSKASFAGARMPRASFVRANLDRADLTAAELPEAVLRRARLRHAKLTGANLMRASLERAKLDSADLRSANLYAAETMKASFASARLDGAHLAGTKLVDLR